MTVAQSFRRIKTNRSVRVKRLVTFFLDAILTPTN